MTLKGKIFMCTTFILIGVAIGLVGGYKFAKAQSNSGNQVNVTVDGKVKKGSKLHLNLEDVKQEQSKKRKNR